MTPASVQLIYWGAGLLLFALGLSCIVTRKSMVKTLIGVETATMGVNIAILAAGMRVVEGRLVIDALAQHMVILSMAIGAAVAALGVALIAAAYRHYKSIDVDKLAKLRW